MGKHQPKNEVKLCENPNSVGNISINYRPTDTEWNELKEKVIKAHDLDGVKVLASEILRDKVPID